MTSRSERRDRVQTVCGLVDPGELGPTLMHEHILCNLTPPDVARRNLPDVEITLENCWEIRHHWGISQPVDLRLEDESVAVCEVSDLREAGCNAVVELSCGGMCGDPKGLRRISESAGIHIIYGTGYYTEEFEPPEVREKSVDDLAENIVRDVTGDVEEETPASGIIGEIGCSHPWTAFERRAVQAAAIAQQEIGAAVNIHPGRHPDAPKAHVEAIRTAGGDPTRVIVSHIDRTIFDLDTLFALADTGCVVEYDFFGIESSYYVADEQVDLPNDGKRLSFIRELIQRGNRDQVVISHDICTKTRLRRYGGHGYTHIPKHVVPMMRAKGFSDADVQAILIDNPRRCLTLT